MDFKYRHTGEISREGRIIFDNRSLFDKQVASLSGSRFELYLRKARKDVSPAQLNFYVGVVLKEAHRHEQYIHYESPKAIHDKVFAPMFLKEYKVTMGKLKEYTPKLSSLSEEQMFDLTERVIAYLACEDGIIIADKSNYYVK